MRTQDPKSYCGCHLTLIRTYYHLLLSFYFVFHQVASSNTPFWKLTFLLRMPFDTEIHFKARWRHLYLIFTRRVCLSIGYRLVNWTSNWGASRFSIHHRRSLRSNRRIDTLLHCLYRRNLTKLFHWRWNICSWVASLIL